MVMMPDLIFHGVGVSQLVFTDGSFVNINKSQDLQIAATVTEQKVNGGDSLYSLLTFASEKTAKLTITDAVFKLEGIKAATGSTITSGAEVWVTSDKKAIATGTCTLSKTTNLLLDTVVANVVETGVTLVKTSGTPTANEFKVSAAGAVTVDTALNGKTVEFSYYYTDANGQAVHHLENDIPKVAEFRHTLISDQMDDGKRYKIDIRAYRCKANGAYTYDAKRGAAFAPKLEFEILDSGRADKRVVSYNVTEYVD
jgi:hypothetical protein